MNKTCTLQYKDTSREEIFKIKNGAFAVSKVETDVVELVVHVIVA